MNDVQGTPTLGPPSFSSGNLPGTDFLSDATVSFIQEVYSDKLYRRFIERLPTTVLP